MKRLFAFLILLPMLFSCTAVVANRQSEKSLVFCRNSDIVLDITEGEAKISGYLSFSGLDGDEIVFTSADESVATVEKTSTQSGMAGYEVIAVGAGSTYITASSSDGAVTSEKLGVTVTAELSRTVVETEEKKETEETHIIPSDETEVAKSDPGNEGYYILNTNTKKIHYPDCPSVSQMKEKNRGTTTDPDAMIAEGYTWCKNCKRGC